MFRTDVAAGSPISMETALRTTLKTLREEAGLSLEAIAQRIAAVRAADGRKASLSHTTIRSLERGDAAAPRAGWDELVSDYAAVLDTTPQAIWRQAAVLYGLSPLHGTSPSRKPRK